MDTTKQKQNKKLAARGEEGWTMRKIGGDSQVQISSYKISNGCETYHEGNLLNNFVISLWWMKTRLPVIILECVETLNYYIIVYQELNSIVGQLYFNDEQTNS